MEERTGEVRMEGQPVTLAGTPVKAGDDAPDFMVLTNNLEPAKLDDFKGQVLVITSVPSLDTEVCELETKKFNEYAENWKGKAKVLTISMDLPFAQKRWCAAEDVDAVITLSDHRTASFGEAYGVLLKELRLLARAVFVVNAEGKITYRQLVQEVTKQPDYDEVVKETEKLF